MAATRKHISPSAQGASSQPATPFDFSLDSVPAKPVLSPDQLRNCSEALSAFKHKLVNSPQSIREEFLTLQAKRIKASDMRNRCSIALAGVNQSKNRYSDVLPFDSNRVVLNQSNDNRPSARGYINASSIMTSESVSQFIATQGPLPHTYEDFWEMVLQYRCPAVVMLTRLVDNYTLLII
jgi:protein tyrosine phosphatase